MAQTSVSGVSSRGVMAAQMHIAHSSIMRGIGVIAGIAYGCADLPLINQRVAQIPWCLNGAIPASFSLARTAEAVAAAAIDDPAAQLPRQNVLLFSGYNDGSVRRAAMDAVAEYYQRYVTSEHTFYKTNNHAPHALITSSYGGTCLGANAKYINNCGYDAAGRLLEHIYGGLKQPRRGRLTGRVRAFDQSEFVDALNPALLGFADKGYVYVPKVCETETCRVHVVFHVANSTPARWATRSISTRAIMIGRMRTGSSCFIRRPSTMVEISMDVGIGGGSTTFPRGS